MTTAYVLICTNHFPRVVGVYSTEEDAYRDMRRHVRNLCGRVAESYSVQEAPYHDSVIAVATEDGRERHFP